MKALAIHYGHNCTVGLSVNGKIICLLSEERISRIKNATGFPIQALDYVVNTFLNGDIDNADYIAFIDGTGLAAFYLLKNGIEPRRYLDYYWVNKKKKFFIGSLPIAIQNFSRWVKNTLSKVKTHFAVSDPRGLLLEKIQFNRASVEFLDHHQCHAATAAYFPQFDGQKDWLVLTLDGEGDGLSSTVSTYSNEVFSVLSKNDRTVSLGYLFAETTAYLGMKPNEHEFKLMGMAPYADSAQVDRLVKELKLLLWIDGDGQFAGSVKAQNLLPQLMRIYAFERFDVISGAIQKFAESLICEWAAYWSNKTGISSIAVSGGVFMNVKAVKQLAECSFINDLFVVPSASDESLPIGALAILNRGHQVKLQPVSHLYLGQSFSDGYVEEMIFREGLDKEFEITRFSSDDAAAEFVGSLLAKNEIVARCAGAEEWGARALGNRSILCNPSNFQNIERLNSKIKCRDFWMPFTPSILSEHLHLYAVNPKEINATYMAITFESTPLAREHLSAAVHPRDFTMRPQAVLKDWNPGYYKIIESFSKKTGIAGILNTSFNLHGEPNVSTPEDAIRTLRESGLDWLLINNTLFHKA